MITTKSVIEGETNNSDFQFNASSGFVINDCTITAGDVTITSTSTSLIAVEASSSTFNIEFSLNVSGDSTNAIGILWQENTISYGSDCTTNFQGNGMGAGLVIEQNTGTTIFQLVTFSGSLASNSPSNIAGLYITGTSTFKFNRNTIFYALAATDDDVPAILVDSHIVFAGLMDVEGDSPFGTGIVFNQIVEINNAGTIVGYGSCLGIAFFDDLTILTSNTVTIEGRISYDNLLSCENGFHAGIYFDNNFITSSGSPLALTGIVDPFFLVDNSYGIYFNNVQMSVDSGSVLGNGESDSFENIGYGILFFESDVVFNSFGVCPVTFIGALYNNADGTGVGVDSSSFTNICIQGIYDAAGFDYGSGNALKFESALVFSPIFDTKFDTYFTTSSIKAGSFAQIPILFMPQADGYEFTNVDFSVATFTSSFIPTIGIDISSSVPIFNNVYFSIDINGGGPFSIGIDFGISQVSDFIGIQCALTNVPIGTGVEFGDINFNGVTYDELYIDSTINGGIGTAVLFNGGVSTSTSSYFDITANVVPDVDSYGVYFTSDVTIYGELHILAFGGYGVFFDTELYIFTFLLDIEAYSDGSHPAVYVSTAALLEFENGNISGEVSIDGTAVHFDGGGISFLSGSECEGFIYGTGGQSLPPIVYSSGTGINLNGCNLYFVDEVLSDTDFNTSGNGNVYFVKHVIVSSGDLNLLHSGVTIAEEGMDVSGSLFVSDVLHVCIAVTAGDLISIYAIVTDCLNTYTPTTLYFVATDMEFAFLDRASASQLTDTAITVSFNLDIYDNVSTIYFILV